MIAILYYGTTAIVRRTVSGTVIESSKMKNSSYFKLHFIFNKKSQLNHRQTMNESQVAKIILRSKRRNARVISSGFVKCEKLNKPDLNDVDAHLSGAIKVLTNEIQLLQIWCNAFEKFGIELIEHVKRSKEDFNLCITAWFKAFLDLLDEFHLLRFGIVNRPYQATKHALWIRPKTQKHQFLLGFRQYVTSSVDGVNDLISHFEAAVRSIKIVSSLTNLTFCSFICRAATNWPIVLL
jgi:hypothetical protein